MTRTLLLTTLAIGFLPAAGRGAEKFELRDGDRVVWIGNTLVEREQRYGHWELLLTLRQPDVTFRNLGWSGDTVRAEARGIFDSPEVGFRRLIDGVKGLEPTVLFIAYGANESFAGEVGLPQFREGLERLLDALAPTKARVVLFSPLPMESLGAPLPDATAQNRNLALYAEAIGDIARKRGHHFADLFSLVRDEIKGEPLTDNGIHLTESGYRRTAPLLLKGLGLEAPKLPAESEKLRATIIEKNRLYFHRWRPQNVTYLFGFRKHEQGKNADEVPRFDPLVAEQEKEIARLNRQEKP